MIDENGKVTVSMDALMRALFKARREYVRALEEIGRDPGPEDECWAEFQNLADEADVDIAKPYPQ